MQDRYLLEDDYGKLLMVLFLFFVGKCKDVIKSLWRIMFEFDKGKGVENLLNVVLYVYQLIFVRNLYKLWFLMIKDEDIKDGEKEEDEFKLFVCEEVKGFFLDGDFVVQFFVFFYSVKNGMELFWLIFCLRVMKYFREEYVRMVVESIESVFGELKVKFSWFKVSVLKEVVERVIKKLLRESYIRDIFLKEVIQSVFEEEI